MIRRVVHEDLVSIAVYKLIAHIGGGLVFVFVPLLLLEKGLELWHVCAFYAGYAAAKLVVNYPSARLINHYGARFGLIVGSSATAIFMVLLAAYVVSGQAWILALAAVAMAFQNSFTWNSEHLHISRVMSMERKSSDLARIASIMRISGIAAPFIGGVIATIFGQVWLTVISAVILFAAIIPVWRLDALAGGHQKADNLRYSLRFAPVRDVVANFGYNAHVLVGVFVWPIYLAVFVPDFRDIGAITTIATLISVVVLLAAGKRGDSGKSYRVLVEGTAASSVVHIGRILASSNPFVITIISSLYHIALDYQQNPWTSLYYAHTRKGGINYIMSMEIAGDIAYVVMWGTLGILAYTLGDNSFFTMAFALAAVVAWLCLLMRRETPLPEPEAA